MVVCIAALIVFSILGIFSAKYRSLAKEAFSCVFRLVTLRPCDTGFDKKIKAKLTGKLLKVHTPLAKIVYKYFKAISIVFVVLFFTTLSYSAYSIYNLAVHGTCGPDSNTCIFSFNQDNACKPSCEGKCQCDIEVCEDPYYVACGGDCNCQRSVCDNRP